MSIGLVRAARPHHADLGGQSTCWRFVSLAGLVLAALALSAVSANAPARFSAPEADVIERVGPAATAVEPGDPPGRLAGIPLTFVPNAGQYPDDDAAFVVQGAGTRLEFGPAGVEYLLRDGRGSAATLGLRFLGGREVAPVGEQPAPTRVSYFRGDRSNWVTGLPTYESIVYRDVWPGIDVVFSGDQRVLKYAFRVAPGADVSAIRLAYAGHDALRLEADGSVRVATGVGAIRDEAPTASQLIGGATVGVPVSYRLDDAAGVVSFDVGAFDSSVPLLIDPAQLVYAGYLGGGSSFGDGASDLALDGAGNAYVVGVTESAPTSFPDGDGIGPLLTFNPTLRGGDDVFVVKINAAGTAFLYASYIGGASSESLTTPAIAVDALGNAYVAGSTMSGMDFPVGGPLAVPSFDSTFGGGWDAFLVKVAASGTGLAYAGFLGGIANDFARDVAIDPAGNAYVVGETLSQADTFTAIGNGQDSTFNDIGGSGSTRDGFVVKVNAAGTARVYGTYIGGGASDQAFGVAVDAAGAAYVAGATRSSSVLPAVSPAGGFPDGLGMYQAGVCAFTSIDCTENGDMDGFVLKLSPQGTVSFVGFVGGSGFDLAGEITVDAAGAAYVVGDADSTHTTFPDGDGIGVIAGPDTLANGGTDAFIVKVAPAGDQLAYASYIGGSATDFADDVVVDGLGRALVSGSTDSDQTTFPDGDGFGPLASFDPTFNQGGDAYVVRVNPAGIAFDLAGYVGGTGTDDAGGIAVDGLGGVYLAGTAGSGPGSFPTGTGIGGITSFDPTENRGGEEGFLVKVATAADLSLAAAVAAPSVAVGGQVPVALTVSNAGPASVGAAVVSVPVPAGVAVAGASASQGSCSVAQAVTCALGALAAGGKATVSLTLVPSLEGPLAANASAASEFEDLAPLNNVAAVQASARVPGGLVLGKAKVKATWAVSRLSGSVTLAGSVREAVTLTVTLAKQARSSTGVGAVRAVAGAAKPCRLAIGKACSVALGAGTFSKTLALARTVPPGTYQLRVTGKAADGLAVPAQTLTVKVPKPPEGVVDRVWVSVQKKSSPRSGVPRTADQFFVHFRFAALPKRRQLVLVIRYPGGERRVVDDYLAARLVEPRQPGPLLPGRWTFTLRSGARTIARAIVNVT